MFSTVASQIHAQNGASFNPAHLMSFIDEIDADRARGLSAGSLDNLLHSDLLNRLTQLRNAVRAGIGAGAVDGGTWAICWRNALAAQAMIASRKTIPAVLC